MCEQYVFYLDLGACSAKHRPPTPVCHFQQRHQEVSSVCPCKQGCPFAGPKLICKRCNRKIRPLWLSLNVSDIFFNNLQRSTDIENRANLGHAALKWAANGLSGSGLTRSMTLARSTPEIEPRKPLLFKKGTLEFFSWVPAMAPRPASCVTLKIQTCSVGIENWLQNK